MADIKTLFNTAIINQHLSLNKIITLKKLGAGESNENYLAFLNNGKKIVIRIANLYGAESLAKEYKTLQSLPQGLAPEPIFLDLSGKILNQPFMIQSFVEGQRVNKWTDELLQKFAQSLALLHQTQKKKITKPINIKKYFYSLDQYFFQDLPELIQFNNLKKLIDKTNNFIENNKSLFTSLKNYSLIHGDLNQDNILLDEKKFKLIDWELAEYNDPARDFATFFYPDLQYFDWRIQLNKTQQKILLDSYQDKFNQDENFVKRVEFWQKIDKAGAIIFCSWKYKKTQQKSFIQMANKLKNSLFFI